MSAKEKYHSHEKLYATKKATLKVFYGKHTETTLPIF